VYWFDGFIFIYQIDKGLVSQVNQERVSSYQSGQMAWSPDGLSVAFDCALTSPETSDVCVIDITSGKYEALTAFQGISNAISIGSWSRNGEWIAFVIEYFPEQGFAEGVLSLINPKTREVQTLYDERNFPEISYITFPDISPKSDGLLYQANVNGKPEVFLIDLDSNTVNQITSADNEFGTTRPIWAPSGDSFFASTALVNETGEIELHPIIFSLNGEVMFQPSNLRGWVVDWIN
ncbi:MAG: TolB family protein, partial [Anaerolineales bacterium]